MTLKELEDILMLKDENVEIREDNPFAFRIFIYSLMGKRKILSYLDKRKEFKVTKISDYPDQGKQYPICVLRMERLRIVKKRKKPKRNATDKT
jgi:hypothetical protein